jgi:hypothetical protein
MCGRRGGHAGRPTTAISLLRAIAAQLEIRVDVLLVGAALIVFCPIHLHDGLPVLIEPGTGMLSRLRVGRRSGDCAECNDTNDRFDG